MSFFRQYVTAEEVAITLLKGLRDGSIVAPGDEADVKAIGGKSGDLLDASDIQLSEAAEQIEATTAANHTPQQVPRAKSLGEAVHPEEQLRCESPSITRKSARTRAKRGRRLYHSAAHRRSMLRKLARALITHEQIVTTLPKAKELRPIVEEIVTLAKKANTVISDAAGKGEGEEEAAAKKALHYRRQAMALLGPAHGTENWDKKDEDTGDTVLKKLFQEIGPRFSECPGGYTRILKLRNRRRRGAAAVIEFLKAGETSVKKKGTNPVNPAPAAPTAETPAAPATDRNG